MHVIYHLIVEQYLELKSILTCVNALILVMGITKYVEFLILWV